MTLANMAFVPPNGLRDAIFNPDIPSSGTALKATQQTPSDQLRDYINNTLLVNLPIDYAQSNNVLALNNTTPFTPTTQYHPSTKGYTDTSITGVVLGQIPDGSLTDTKLSNTAGQIKDTVTTHLASNTQQQKRRQMGVRI